MKERESGWQPFLFAESIDIKLEEAVQLIYHFLHRNIFNVSYFLYKCVINLR